MAKVVLENLEKTFAEPGQNLPLIKVLRSINLTVEDGEFLVLVGPSGCGKSTLLRLIAGLEDLSSGKIWIGDRPVNNLAPSDRDIAMVFQNYALYPHLSVYDNIAFGLRRLGQFENYNPILTFFGNLTRVLPPKFRYLSKQEKTIQEQVLKVAKMLQIENLLNRFPKQLSGGQKQRVALGRAIARNPQVFLMDEPLSNLDAKLRTETRSQIVKLQRQLGITTIYVTHDQTEAMTMGSRLVVINQGQIQQIGEPLELYQRPANKFVAEFIGNPKINFFTVEVVNPKLLKHPQFSLKLNAEILETMVGRLVLLGVRPEDFYLSDEKQSDLKVKIDLIEALGNETYIEGHLSQEPDTTLKFKVPSDKLFKASQEIYLKIAEDKIHLFDLETEQSINSLTECDDKP